MYSYGEKIQKVYLSLSTHEDILSCCRFRRPSAAVTRKQITDPKMCLLNPNSVCIKTSILQDFVTDHNMDLMVFTETWLKEDDRGNVILAVLQPPGYTIKHNARQGRGGSCHHAPRHSQSYACRTFSLTSATERIF